MQNRHSDHTCQDMLWRKGMPETGFGMQGLLDTSASWLSSWCHLHVVWKGL